MAAKEAEPIVALEVAAKAVCDAANAASHPDPDPDPHPDPDPDPHSHPHKKFQGKRKRRFTSDARPRGGGGVKHHPGYRPPHKKTKTSVSSTQAANNVMKFRLGGSVSDPLNLEGGDNLGDECSTCAPSPAAPVNKELTPPPLLTPLLSKDPLNLEGKVKNFPLLAGGAIRGSGKAVHPAGQRRKARRRTTSGSKPAHSPTSVSAKPLAKGGKFRYGNYNRYYGYRNNGVNERDPRLSLLHKEWLEGQDCLDIGCNTGQVTMKLAKDMCPKSMVGIDIDNNLIKMAWKNLHRSYIPSVTPDGQPFPSSLTKTRGPVDFPPTTGCSSTEAAVTVEAAQQHRGNTFPYNIQFVQGNYVPADDVTAESQSPEFDVILALSLSKWIHLNWGDAGIKRFFKKIYHHLRPGGRFIFEPQPFKCYAKKKKLNGEIFQNYQNIKFRPHQFQHYLMSSEVGFIEHKFLGIPDNKSKGFQRPIYMYIKGTGERSTTSDTRPQSSLSSDSPVEDTGRLKSVVHVISMESSTQDISNPSEDK